MTAVERAAQEMFRVWNQEAFANDGDWSALSPRFRAGWLILAMRHLREVRRARGRTVGYVALSKSRTHIVEPTIVAAHPWQSAVIGSTCARVVLVPSKKPAWARVGGA